MDEPASAKSPDYVWSCAACGTSNPAGSSTCGRCDLPAYASGKSIAQRKRSLQSVKPPFDAHLASKEHFAGDWTLFFPEGIFAILVVLALPFWVGKLLFNGALASAASLLLLAGSGIAIGVIAWREKNKWLLYGGVVLILLGAWSALQFA